MYNIAIIGGGIVGLATALALTETGRTSLIVLEAEGKVAQHQTGHNSGVIHSGLYYKPGSLKAKTCAEGLRLMYDFCAQHGIAHERCGKVVVATQPQEIPRLDDLQNRGIANGIEGIKRLRPAEIKQYEPHVAGIDGLFVPITGIVDYVAVCEKYAELVRTAGGEVRTDEQVTAVHKESAGLRLITSKGEVSCKMLVNCGGLLSDRVAQMCSVDSGVKIVPFRGEYYELRPDRQHLVKNLVYPVPDPAFPFLGVHFTRMIHGGIEAGPNAVLAFKRYGYTRTSFNLGDALETLTYRGFHTLAAKYWRMGMGEFYRSFSKRAFVTALQRLLPELQIEDVTPAGAGVRAQALDKNGKLLDDFAVVESERMVHVLNAPSPAATASLSIGKSIAGMVAKHI